MFSNNFVKSLGILLLTVVVALFIASSSHAADNKAPPASPQALAAPTPNPPSAPMAEPNPNDNPMLAQYIKDGIQLYYLGSHSGLDGWFLFKDGQVQIVYTTADKKSILIGVLYSTAGEGITESEIQTLQSMHPEIVAAVQQNMLQMQKNNLNPTMPAAGPNGFARPLPPGDKLVQELQAAAGVDLGDRKAPQIYMIMDPNCPHCQATWKMLRDAVFKNTLQIHMIPIGRNDEEERAAVVFLKSKDPLNAWDKYAGGDKTQFAGDADPLTLAMVKTNHTVIDRWSINETPYIVYRGKDKKIKIIAGEPQKVETFLADIGSQ